MPFRALVVMLLLVNLSSLQSAFAQTVNIGVLAFRPKPETQQQWRPLTKALKQSMPQHDFFIRAFSYPEMEEAVRNKQVDFILTNPAHFILLKYRHLGVAAPLATLIAEEQGSPLNSFGGVIFTRADRKDIRQISDLKGLRLAAPDTGSFGGYQAEAYELSLMGLHLPQDVHMYIVGMPHDNAVNLVLKMEADAGFVRTGVLEGMAREGKLDLRKIKVLNPQQVEGFPWLLSTRLYPEWPFAALPHTDQSIARRVAAVLFELEENTAVTQAIGIHGFSTPSDYSAVEELERELRLPPFENAPKFTAEDIWTRYRWQSMIAITAVILILSLSASLMLTNRSLKNQRIRLENETHLRKGLLDTMAEGVYGVDNDGLCSFINPMALQMLGYAEGEILGKDQHALFHHHHQNGAAYEHQDCPIHQSLLDGRIRHLEDWFWRKEGSGFPVSLTVSPHVIGNKKMGAVVVFHDITERRLSDEHLRHLAQHDVLTDLPNRTLLMDRLQQAMAYAKRNNTRVAVLFVDLDRFKPINDTLGHVVGDWLLQQVAMRMRACIRDSDTVARVGGDEFVILLRSFANVSDARLVGEKILETLSQPYELAQQKLHISCSIGIALFPETSRDETEMLNFADMAMYEAKQAGRNQLRIFGEANTSQTGSPSNDTGAPQPPFSELS